MLYISITAQTISALVRVLLYIIFMMCGTGTNDKAGAASFLQRWVSPLSIKETFVPCSDWSYPSVDKK